MPRVRRAGKPRWTPEEAIEAFKKGWDAAESGSMRLLVIRHIGMGDVVQALITAEALKRRYRCSLAFQTTPDYFTICERFGIVDELLSIEEDADLDAFDLAIDLRRNVDFLPYCATAPRLNLMANTARLEWRRLDFDFRIPFLPEDLEYGETFLRQQGLRTPIIGLHTSSSSHLRQWGRSEELAKMLLKEGFQVLCLNREPSPELWNMNGVVAVGVQNVDRLFGLISQCEAVICVDSGVMHLCGITETPFLALFGPIRPDLRILYFRRRRSIWMDDLPCSPCHDWQLTACDGRDYHRACMLRITPQMVFQKLMSFKKVGYV